jgi:hypothetical protein
MKSALQTEKRVGRSGREWNRSGIGWLRYTGRSIDGAFSVLVAWQGKVRQTEVR